MATETQPVPRQHPLTHTHACTSCGKVVSCTNGECVHLATGTCADKCGRRDPLVRA